MPANRGTTLASTGPRMSLPSPPTALPAVRSRWVAYYETSSTLEETCRNCTTRPASPSRESAGGDRMRPIHPSADAVGTPIGAKLRSTRIAQGLTLAQVAESSGPQQGFPQPRRARRDLPERRHARAALPGALASRSGRSSPSPRSSASHEPTRRTSTSAVSASPSSSCPRAASPACSCIRSALEPGAHGGHELYTVNCDVEVLHVVAGAVTVRFADRSVRLETGDALTFPGREPHTWHAEDDAPAEVCWVLVPAPWSGSSWGRDRTGPRRDAASPVGRRRTIPDRRRAREGATDAAASP